MLPQRFWLRARLSVVQRTHAPDNELHPELPPSDNRKIASVGRQSPEDLPPERIEREQLLFTPSREHLPRSLPTIAARLGRQSASSPPAIGDVQCPEPVQIRATSRSAKAPGTLFPLAAGLSRRRPNANDKLRID